jgi:5-oxoprolinase (ATP-hydrolysing) subunit C
MSTIHVQAPGMFTTVQDLGRPGYGPLGVSRSGAADSVSLRIGNLLVGNPENAAALEMTLLGGTFAFPDGGVAALAGSDFGATLNNSPIPLHEAVELKPGEVVKTGPTKSGARCYLCVRGGIAVKPLLGSSSTHILSGLGGLEGRPLCKGDVLHVAHSLVSAVSTLVSTPPSPRKIFRATVAPQTDRFSLATRRTFFTSVFTVTEESNRMGIRLTGPVLETPHKGHMTSEGVSLGAIQVPSSGQPIIIFVEQQTTGGYPKIANVVSADLPSVGQLRPRDEIQFELVTPTYARDLIREQEAYISQCIST